MATRTTAFPPLSGEGNSPCADPPTNDPNSHAPTASRLVGYAGEHRANHCPLRQRFVLRQAAPQTARHALGRLPGRVSHYVAPVVVDAAERSHSGRRPRRWTAPCPGVRVGERVAERGGVAALHPLLNVVSLVRVKPSDRSIAHYDLTPISGVAHDLKYKTRSITHRHCACILKKCSQPR